MSNNKHRYGAITALLLPTALLVDTVFAWLLGWQHVGTLEAGGTALIITLFIVALLAVAWPNTRQHLHAKELGLLTLTLCVTVACVEIGANFLEQKVRRSKFPQATAAFHTRGPDIHRDIALDPTLITGITGNTHYRTDAHGIRAAHSPSPSQTFRILTVGGSTTECTYIDDTETWAAQLQTTLNEGNARDNAWIGNVGISGYASREHLRFIQETDLLKDIDVVIVQPGINDLWRYLANEEEEIDFGRFAPSTSEVDPEAKEPWRPLWSRARLIQLYHTLRMAAPEVDEAEAEGVGGTEYQIRRARRAAATITNTLPPLEAGRATYRNRIRGLIDAGQARNIKLAFTTQPVLWANNLSPEVAARCWFGWRETGQYLSLPTLRQAMDAYNADLLAVCVETNTPIADLAAMNGNPDYFYDDCHFTEAGAAEVARLLAHHVKPFAD